MMLNGTSLNKVRVMKKWLLCLCVYLIPVLSSKNISADTPTEPPTATNGPVDEYIRAVYNSFDFARNGNLTYEVFEKAMTGYLNLRAAGKLNTRRSILTVCDFTRSSSQYRMWVLDLEKKKIIIHHYVAHGQGTGDEFAKAFSNVNESHQSSLGFFVTGDTYQGQHGTSLRLHGMDAGWNNAAYDRAIVIHGADYVCRESVQAQGRIGRSWGCPAVNEKLAPEIINAIRGGTALYIYYPNKQYMKTAYWLNKKVEKMPTDFLGTSEKTMLASALPPVKKKADTVIIRIPVGSPVPESLY